jgi:7-carboxy-7-deazaguanine synthase
MAAERAQHVNCASQALYLGQTVKFHFKVITLIMKKYRYSECFQSIQGEGHYIGAPSMFLRLWGCNFSCTGFSNPDRSKLNFSPAGIHHLKNLPVITQGCDTVYAWHKDYQHLSMQATASEICDILEGFYPSFHHPKSGQSIHLVVTGGEPMLSQGAITEIINTFKHRNNLPHHVTIETNGTQAPSEPLKNLLNCSANFHGEWFWSVSPKLSLSGENWKSAILPNIVSQYAKLSNAGQLKFVVDGSEKIWDEVEIAIAIYQKSGINWNTWIMPVGASQQSQEEHQERICIETIKRGYNFSPRVHNWIFGNRTGT